MDFLIHVIHQFAHVPSLVRNCNVVFDERPSRVDIPNGRVQRAVTAYLKAADSPVSTLEAFV
ncbi:hypothetical protein [Halarchaeum nitratireducens]|uniref:Uncharacterized protein n=1 Tax=Halarchaeum nitratireducens TaxID=489913 RepID=A0A830GFX2_9EURY|nr:hypothetical protein [Halarchaeum nitratireducens]GGN24966.1 hypothetical protein GCM10009021_28540 [Halarchaeum nitratireducens]